MRYDVRCKVNVKQFKAQCHSFVGIFPNAVVTCESTYSFVGVYGLTPIVKYYKTL